MKRIHIYRPDGTLLERLTVDYDNVAFSIRLQPGDKIKLYQNQVTYTIKNIVYSLMDDTVLIYI